MRLVDALRNQTRQNFEESKKACGFGGGVIVNSGFNDVGFLGDDLGSWRDSVRAQFPESFAIADRVNRMGMRMIYEFPDGPLPEARVLAIAGFYRALQSFQSVIILTEKGAMAEARALARLCCEAVIVTGGLLKVDGTVQRLKEDHAKHRLSMANSVIRMCQAENASADVTRFEQEVDSILAEYPEKPNSIKLDSLSVQAGLKKLYELSFRLPSGDGAHVTLGALHRHFDKNDQEEFRGMIFHPDQSDVRATLHAANAALIQLLDLAQNYMGLGEYQAEIHDLLLQWEVSRHEIDPRPV